MEIHYPFGSLLQFFRNHFQVGNAQTFGFHKIIFEFLREANFDESLIDYFDNIRKLRNNFLYEFKESSTKESAEETILKAEDFVQKIRTFVQKIRTGGK